MQDLEHQPPKQTILRYFAMGVGPPSGSARRFAVTDMSSFHPVFKINLLLGGTFCVGNPYVQTQFATWRSVLCGQFLFTNSIGCISILYTIYKLIFKPHSKGRKRFSGRQSVVRNPCLKP